MIDEKGLDPAAADKIGELVVHKSEPGACLALLDKLEAETLAAIPRAVAALKELRLLFTCVVSSSWLRVAIWSLPLQSCVSGLRR